MVLPSLVSLSTVSMRALLLSRLSVVFTAAGTSSNFILTSLPSFSSPFLPSLLSMFMLVQPIKASDATSSRTDRKRMTMLLPFGDEIRRGEPFARRDIWKLDRHHEIRVKLGCRKLDFD